VRRLRNALCFRGVAGATPQIQNVLRRSRELHQTDIVAQLRTPGVATWWREHRPLSFSPEFTALVEEILGEEEEPERGE